MTPPNAVAPQLRGFGKTWKALCFSLLLALFLFVTSLALGEAILGDASAGTLNSASGDATQLDWTVITSTVSRECLSIVPNRTEIKSAQDKVLLLYEGTPAAAYLVLTSCGVKSGKHHTLYLNGQPVAQVEDDPYNTCICYSSGQAITYTLSSPDAVLSGWNYISITNDADLTDGWMAYDAQLVVEGNLADSAIKEFSFTSSYDSSVRRAAYQLPVGHDPGIPVPLLVSIGGSGEDKWTALFRFAERTNSRGWLLLAPDIRPKFGAEGGRTASLAVQHDIMDAIDYVLADPAFGADPTRVYLSGFSTGGGIAATVAAKYPDRFAAAADWAGPNDLKEWVEQRPEIENSLISDIGCGLAGPGLCPWEWQRRSGRLIAMNLKHVPTVIVHGREDTAVPFAQSEDFYNYMQRFYDPVAYHKLAVWHDGGHADWLPSFEGLDWMADFTLFANPTDIKIRSDESKSYYWVTFDQKDWNGNWADGYSDVEASYDLATRVISATVWDERAFRNGNLPLDVTFDLRAMGFDPYASYTVEDYNVATGDYELKTVSLTDGRLKVSLPRDRLSRVHHQYLIYPFAPSELFVVPFQQGVSPSEYDGVEDTYLYQYEPDAHYATSSELLVNNGGSLLGLLRFDLSRIPGEAVVKKAHLTLHLGNTPPSEIDVSLHRLLPRWVDTEANWNLVAQGVPWAVPGVQGADLDYDPAPISVASNVRLSGPYVFNLKSVLKDWLTGAVPNEGVAVVGPRPGGSGSIRYRFASSEAGDPGRRPKLEVVYMLPTATPTPTATPMPTATPTPTACTMEGSVTMQGRPAPPHASWSVPLTVTVGSTSYTVATDQSGKFILSDLTPGTYDIRVKSSHTLRNLKSGVALVAGTNTIDLGTLVEGDANDDNAVNIKDFSILAAGFYPSYDARADFNEDGYVNISDFSLLVTNFGLYGDISGAFQGVDLPHWEAAGVSWRPELQVVLAQEAEDL